MTISEILKETSLDNLPSLLSSLRSLEKIESQLSTSVKVFGLRNFTIEGVGPYLKYHLYGWGIRPEIEFGDYGVIHQEILNESSLLNSFQPEIIILGLDLEELEKEAWMPSWSIDKAWDSLLGLYESLEEKTSCLIVLNTFLPPFYYAQGISTSLMTSSLGYRIQKLNQMIRDFTAERSSRFLLADWERFLRVLGEEQSVDYRYWYLTKSPFKQPFLNLYAEEIAKIASALKGKSKKCLILDCDNTLWGGIVGEDGIDGIKLDPNDYPGKIYHDFQKTVLLLAARGVMVALCSKNNEEDVLEVLDNHPHSLIKRSDLVAWRINWQDKAKNIIEISKELNIGLDSVVFVDDNSIECDLVKTMVPDVTVIQTPTKLYQYPPLLLKKGLFETLAVSSEDRTRTLMYKQEAKRKEATQTFDNLEEYLASLEIVASISPLIQSDVSRAAQLTQKTNQFNLTNQRYSEGDILNYMNDPECAIFTLAVKDKFGEYGLTGIAIFMKKNNIAIIDTFLLSCRIIGRDIEYAFIQTCVDCIDKHWSPLAWEAQYKESPKNGQVADYWGKCGFNLKAHGEGEKRYHSQRKINVSRRFDFIEIVGKHLDETWL